MSLSLKLKGGGISITSYPFQNNSCAFEKELKMRQSKANTLTRLLTTAFALLHSKSLICLAGLCEDNSNICEFHAGSYVDHNGRTQDWWAFKPIGSLACPPEGCPLYTLFDGTYPVLNDSYLLKMLKRGFVAAKIGYESSLVDYGAGENYCRMYSLKFIMQIIDRA